MNNKKIGLLCDIDEGKWSFNMAYLNWARRFSRDVELISPLDTEVRDFDLLILPGGADVLPARYGEFLQVGTCGMPNFRYEQFDCETLPNYIQQGTPIFGICRGLQTLNVHFNGSLHQHIYGEPSSMKHRGELVQEIRTANGMFRVNSLHHQAIKKLGEDIVPIAYSITRRKGEKNPIDRYVEAIKHTKRSIVAVQFHPEELCYQKDAVATTQWVDNLVRSIIR